VEKQFITWLLLIHKILVASEVNIWHIEAMFVSLTLAIQKLVLYLAMFSTIKISDQNRWAVVKGSILSLLNNSLHGILFFTPASNVIIFCWEANMFLLPVKFPHTVILKHIMEWKYAH